MPAKYTPVDRVSSTATSLTSILPPPGGEMLVSKRIVSPPQDAPALAGCYRACGGGDQFRQEVSVNDLHAITPDEVLQFGDAIVHTLSYQQARHFNLPVAGVFVANPGYVFSAAAIPRGTVILSVNGKRTLGGR